MRNSLTSTLEELRHGAELPSPGPVAMRLMELASRDDVTAPELARVLQTDPALAGRLLKLANSAAVGHRGIASVTEAVVRLGFHGVRQLALGFSLVDRCRAGACQGFDYDGFWAGSLARAAACEAVARDTRLLAPDDAFTIGLLADIGTLALASVHPRTYGEVWRKSPEDEARRARETAAYGVCHRELSAMLMSDWGLPAPLVTAVRYRGETERCEDRIGRIGELLDQGFHLGRWLVAAGDGQDVPPGLVGRLGALARRPEDVVARAAGGFAEWTREMGVPRATTTAASAPRPPGDAVGPRRALRALVVEDSESQRLTLTRLLETLEFDVAAAVDGLDALGKLTSRPADLVLSDVVMPRLDGFGLCRAIRKSASAAAYVVMLTTESDAAQVLNGFDAGADDYLTKPVDVPELRARVRAARRVIDLQLRLAEEANSLRELNARLEAANASLAASSLTDALTGLPNRRQLLQRLREEWAGALRSGSPFALIYADVDHFKSINDTRGHDAGDVVLGRVGRVLRRGVRQTDVVGRFGGEEFLAICPNADEAAAVGIAERIRAELESEEYSLGGSVLRVTASFGVACIRPEPGSVDGEELIRKADAALYEAKSTGRNRVVVRRCA
jgi:diguanylate cyclase (GGDEF)-like protein